jgi:hypothetical protein
MYFILIFCFNCFVFSNVEDAIPSPNKSSFHIDSTEVVKNISTPYPYRVIFMLFLKKESGELINGTLFSQLGIRNYITLDISFIDNDDNDLKYDFNFLFIEKYKPDCEFILELLFPQPYKFPLQLSLKLGDEYIPPIRYDFIICTGIADEHNSGVFVQLPSIINLTSLSEPIVIVGEEININVVLSDINNNSLLNKLYENLVITFDYLNTAFVGKFLKNDTYISTVNVMSVSTIPHTIRWKRDNENSDLELYEPSYLLSAESQFSAKLNKIGRWKIFSFYNEVGIPVFVNDNTTGKYRIIKVVAGEAEPNNSAVYKLWHLSIPNEKVVSFEAELRDNHGNLVGCNDEFALEVSWSSVSVYAEKLKDEYTDGGFRFSNFSQICDVESSRMLYRASCSDFPLRGEYTLHYELFKKSLVFYEEDVSQNSSFVIYSSSLNIANSSAYIFPIVTVDDEAVYISVIGRDSTARDVECHADGQGSFTVDFALQTYVNDSVAHKELKLEPDGCQGGEYNFIAHTHGIVTKAGIYNMWVLFNGEYVGSAFENLTVQFSVGEFTSDESEIIYPKSPFLASESSSVNEFIVAAGGTFEIDIICKDQYGNNECCDNNPNGKILFFPYANISSCHVSKNCTQTVHASVSVNTQSRLLTESALPPLVYVTEATFTCSAASTFNITPCFTPNEYTACYSPFKSPLTVTVTPLLPSPSTSYTNISSLVLHGDSSPVSVPIYLRDIYSNSVSCDAFEQAFNYAIIYNTSVQVDNGVSGDEVTPDFIKLYLIGRNGSFDAPSDDISSFFTFTCISNNVLAINSVTSEFIKNNSIVVGNNAQELMLTLQIYLRGVRFTDITFSFAADDNDTSITMMLSTIMGFLLIFIVILIFVVENYACMCAKSKPWKPNKVINMLENASSVRKEESVEKPHNADQKVNEILNRFSITCNWKLNPSEIRLYKAIGKGFQMLVYIYVVIHQGLQEKCSLGSLQEQGLLLNVF